MAFESAAWERFHAGTEVLTKIWRQSDQAFVDALNLVRRGDGRGELGYFRKFFADELDLDFDGVTLVAANKAVEAHNTIRLERLEGERMIFHSQRWGRQAPEWKNIPEIVETKTGAVVMLLANKRLPGEPPEYEYVNGDLGHLIGRDGAAAVVELFRNNRRVTVKPVERQVWTATGRKREQREVDGAITYTPIRLAYATSIHKSQSLSLDRVQVDFRAGFLSQTPGGLYVALSRARSADGLRLVGDAQQFVTRCRVHARVRQWL